MQLKLCAGEDGDEDVDSIILVRQTSNVNSSSAPIVRNYTESFRYY